MKLDSLPRCVSAILVAWIGAGFTTAADISFNRDIRPILSENCFHCHGPDEAAREADLRLDQEDAAKEYAVVPGDVDASELFARIIDEDPDTLMPPPDSERALTTEQIETIKQWIDQGAPYEGHWSFVKPTKPIPPEVAHPAWVQNAIDRFVLAKIETEKVSPAEPASKSTLIRRATFDLTGLPPTLEEIDAFMADNSANAYERLIDGLLQRHAFGERMAADWLDAARYSDTYGFQVDRDRFVWPWRDWVIEAFNQNTPYDHFITQQLAGDLLPDAATARDTRNQILATTFNRLHPQKVEGGSVPEEFRIEYIADRTQTFGTAFMGLTLECCRCHSHKYDPIRHQEYYQLSAFFDNIDEAGLYSYFTPAIPTPTLTLPTSEQERELAKRLREVRLAENALLASIDEHRFSDKDTFEDGITNPHAVLEPIDTLNFEIDVKSPNQSVTGVAGNAVRLTGDDAITTLQGNFDRWQSFSVSLWIKTPDKKERAVVFHRSRAWTDAASRGYELLIDEGRLRWSLIHFWPGNAISVRTRQTIPLDKWMHVTVSYDGSSRADGLRIYLDGEAVELETVRDGLSKTITGGGGDTIAIGERFRDKGFKGGSVDQYRLYDRELTGLEVRWLAESTDLSTLKSDIASSSRAPAALVHQHVVHRHVLDVRRAKTALADKRKSLFQLQDTLDEIMVMRELEQSRPSYRLDRGAYDARQEQVHPQTPAALPPFPDDAPRNRLGLARWLTDPNHPLTSRVAINRLWQQCFGQGLVRTPEDFGSQGKPPTHPELMDWLAVTFIEEGWDVKRMLKRIMMSATYRQSSIASHDDVIRRDPANEWLARFPAYRLQAEMLRDNALAISGRLSTRIGGPPVKPYELETSFKPSEPDEGEGLYRRSLYTYWKRTGPAPVMMTLDASKRDVCRVQRERTSSPLQALVLLNGPQFVEAARGLAEVLIQREDGDPARVIAKSFRYLTGREPDDIETTTLQNLYEKQLEYFRTNSQSAQSYLGIGDSAPSTAVDRPQLAATAVVINTIMNFDESMMKR
tara:strand:+ start:6876 stop:9971 length:3096 start_codon:yes stop_codon:yes gene_type:complete